MLTIILVISASVTEFRRLVIASAASPPPLQRRLFLQRLVWKKLEFTSWVTKNRENNRKTKVKSKKPKFRKTLEEALLLYIQKGARKYQFSCMSTAHSGKLQLRMRKEKSSGTTEVLSSRISKKKCPVDNLCQSYFETTINIIFCSSSSTEAKMVKTRSSDAVSASSTTAEENNITFN
ncbi:hypothetical protein L5515_013124 [Caenorhabditis briggsae]|uniref:Uncharacterized protein n=1 Tax=Caenorhabditis briggsae TaxID=6238 RepID=A0AAE9EAG0_CAEBR|nr:hypothetical protein L5515_013124 [Caenorhabditis briggsae]